MAHQHEDVRAEEEEDVGDADLSAMSMEYEENKDSEKILFQTQKVLEKKRRRRTGRPIGRRRSNQN